MKRLELAGSLFGKWTVLHRAGPQKWFCKCECGRSAEVYTSNLRSGKSTQCGVCWHNSLSDKFREKMTVHGERYTRLYNIWAGIKNRCVARNNKTSSLYGDRGIRVCDEWVNDFVAFKTWAIANGYDDGLSIDRIDANGNYEPTNCRWATAKQQSRNRRKTDWMEFEGARVSIADVAERVGIPYYVIRQRLKKGWSVDRATATPVAPRRRVQNRVAA